MPQLYIPEIGDTLLLTEDWVFDLYNEYRNETLMEFIKDTRDSRRSHYQIDSLPCTIPAGEQLKIDRIYIRKGNAEFSSVSFLWMGKRTQRKTETRYAVSHGGYGGYPPVRSEYQVTISAKPVRFWAKLVDVNKIVFTHET